MKVHEYKILQVKGYSVVVHYAYPPIPWRNFDFVAYIEGDEESGDYGYGKTEKEAIQDLMEIQGEYE